MHPLFWHCAAAVLHLAALGLLIKAIIGRREAGGVCCPRCGYDMSGSPGSIGGVLTCPECGRVAGPEEWSAARGRWRHRRKHWRLAVVAVLLQFVAGYNWYRLLPGRQGVIGLVPTSLLVLLVDDPMGQDPMAVTLRERFGHGHYWRWQATIVV